MVVEEGKKSFIGGALSVFHGREGCFSTGGRPWWNWGCVTFQRRGEGYMSMSESFGIPRGFSSHSPFEILDG